MLTPNELLDGAEALLRERFPSDGIYRHQKPAEVTGACFLLEMGEIKLTDAGCATVDVTAALHVTAFPAAGEPEHSAGALAERMTAVQALFASDCLRTGGRTLRAVESTGSYTPERAVVKLKLEYREDRPERENWPMMGEIQTKIKEESKYGTA